MTNSTDRSLILQELFENLQAYAPNMNFKRHGNQYDSLCHLDGERGAKGQNQTTAYPSGIIKDFGGSSMSLIDWYAVQYLHGAEGDEKGNFKKICEFLNLSNDAQRQNIANNAVFRANATRREKERTKVYLTKDSADFKRLFANGYWLNLKGRMYSQTFGNTLVQYLMTLFSPDIVRTVLSRYVVMANADAVLFVYCDSNGRISRFKEMKYKANGHRVKESEDKYTTIISSAPNMETNAPNVITKRQSQDNEEEGRLLYGQQFVRPGVDVYAVESEKTAIMLKCFLMENGIEGECVALGGKGNLWLLHNITEARSVKYIPDIKKDVSISQVLEGCVSDIADVDAKALNDIFKTLYSRGIATKIDMSIYKAVARCGKLTEGMIKAGSDVADIIELTKNSKDDEALTIYPPERPQTIPGATKITGHPFVDLSVLEMLIKTTDEARNPCRYGFEMFSQVQEDGDTILTFDFHLSEHEYWQVLVAYSPEANKDVTRENINKMFYSVFGVNYSQTFC